MRLEFATRGAAQLKADEIHAWMIANRTAYAKSVNAGKTTAWAIPYQDLDVNDNPINTLWYVNAKERCRSALSSAEQLTLKPYRMTR
jgi:hypothetical protein